MKLIIAVLLAVATTRVRSDLLTTSEQQEAVTTQNKARTDTHTGANFIKLTWDDELADLANDWATQCKFGHGGLERSTTDSGYDVDHGVRVGQNIFYIIGGSSASAAPALDVTRAVNGWVSEKQFFTLGINGAASTCDSEHVCGHYTQVVWAPSKDVGCAYARCDEVTVESDGTSSVLYENALIFVCNYYEAGNVLGENPYIEGVPCNLCKDVVVSDYGYTCDQGLCAVCDSTDIGCECPDITCQNGGVLATDSCVCDCTDTGYTGRECSQACACDTAHPDKCFCQDAVGFPCDAYKALCTDPMYAAFMAGECFKTCGYCADTCTWS